MNPSLTTVEVTLIDGATGEPIGVTQLPAADLPESFELNTTLHIGDAEWSVISAQPKTRAECAESKTLTLRLYRIEKISPANILYSLPTIVDPIAPVGDQPLEDDELVLPEDDWRQFEFVSSELATVVDEELAKIRLIHENAAAQVGWREIHLRTQPETPIADHLTLDELANHLGVSDPPAGVTYLGAHSRIADGYSFIMAEKLWLYGVAPGGTVQAIGIGLYSDSAPGEESIERLRALALNRNLDLVRWCSCIRVASNDPLFVSLLTGKEF